MYILSIFITLSISLLNLLFGKFIGRSGVVLLSISGLMLNAIIIVIVFYEISLSKSICVIELFEWVDLLFFFLNIGFYFDVIASIMFIVVCFISFFVHLYSIEYMGHDPCFNRFMAYLSLFTFFMLFLVISDNYIQMFIGWEGVGLSSYLLINFWYTRTLANKAAIKAMLINRIGDLSLIISMIILFYIFGSLNYMIVFSLVSYLYCFNFVFFGFDFNILTLICFFIFLGAMGKSAQIGLHIWLPDAMEGPTPVSALIHAATMVTAGVFLVIRSSFLFEFSENSLFFVGIIGSLTCLIASIIGLFQVDIKKIVAYSTCSQLGYMFFSCGMSNYSISLFHLFNHAFFKALLFLSMGSIIHALNDEQDLRFMGGLIRLLPFTYVMVMIGSMSLIAMPYLTGYYSKDMLLEFTYSMFTLNGYFFYFIGSLAAFFTACYSMRLLVLIFITKTNLYKSRLIFIRESGLFITFSLFILSLCSIYIGYLFNEFFLGVGVDVFENSILNLFNYSIFDSEFNILFIFKIFPFIISLFGIIFYIFLYWLNIYNFFKYYWFIFFFKFFSKAMLFDLIFIDFFFMNILSFSYFYMYKYVEKGIFELLGPLLFFNIIKFFKKYMEKINDGLIYNYIFLILVNILFIFLFFKYIYILGYGILFCLFLGLLKNVLYILKLELLNY